VIQLDGLVFKSMDVNNVNGLTINSSNVAVQNLVIGDCTGNGVEVMANNSGVSEPL
jgi:hypothetical protein